MLLRLCDEGHYAADKIHKKAANLEERRKNNHTKANDQLEKAKDSLQLHQYLQVGYRGRRFILSVII